jgi:hypothetical protein
MSELVTNVQVKKNALDTFVINPLIHIRQKEKIALKIAVKVASVNGPLRITLQAILSSTISCCFEKVGSIFDFNSQVLRPM